MFSIFIYSIFNKLLTSINSLKHLSCNSIYFSHNSLVNVFAVKTEKIALLKSLLKVIKDAGVQVNEADKGAFIAASKGIYDQFGSEVPTGGALVDKVSSLAN